MSHCGLEFHFSNDVIVSIFAYAFGHLYTFFGEMPRILSLDCKHSL